MLFIKSKEKQKLLTNVVSLFVLQGSNYIIPLISVPFLFKKLDVEKFGLVNFSFSFIQYFIILTDFGYNLSATKVVAEHRDDKARLQQVFNSVLGAKALLFIIGLAALTAIVLSVPGFSDNKSIYFISYGLVLGSILFPVWFFQGMEKMKLITWLSICIKIIAILPLFFLVRSSADYLYVPVFNTIASIFCGCLSLYLISKDFDIHPGFSTYADIKNSLKESSPFFLSRISVSLYTTSNVVALGMFNGKTAVGYYSAAEKLFQAIQNAYSPINSSLYPFMTKNKDKQLFKKVFSGAVIFNIIMIGTLLFFSHDIITLLYKKDSVESMKVFRLLLCACLVIVPSVMLGYPFLAALGYSNFTNKTVIGPSIFHLVAIVILYFTHRLSIYSVAALVIITESLVFITRVIGVLRFRLLSDK